MNTEITNSLDSDIEIIEKVINGETRVYSLIVKRYNPFLYKIGKTYGLNHEDVQDVMQETYVNSYRNLSKFRKESSFKTWLTRIMINNCYHRKKSTILKRSVPFEPSTTQRFTNLSTDYMNHSKTVNKELGKILEKSILALPEKYKIVFTLRELNELSIAETSEALNISTGNVKARLSRAKSMLRNEIEKMYSREEIFDFNLIYCDGMVDRVMNAIENLP